MHIVKHLPNDFLVSEILDLELSTNVSEYSYYRLKKNGWTTFDAISSISQDTGIGQRAIGFAGLKDEDGITEQFISVLGCLPESYWRALSIEEHGMALAFVGFGSSEIQIGQNRGNQFVITVRNLDEADVRAFVSASGRQTRYVNYYDDQRFGLPGQPKYTHLIGEHYARREYEKCIELGVISGVVKPGATVDEVPVKQRAFWLNAAGSAKWNAHVAQWASERFEEHRLEQGAAGALAYVSTAELSNLPCLPEAIKLTKYRVFDGEIHVHPSHRSPIEQFLPTVVATGECEHFPGRFYATVEFSLGTGSYATLAIKSLLLGAARNEARPSPLAAML